MAIKFTQQKMSGKSTHCKLFRINYSQKSSDIKTKQNQNKTVCIQPSHLHQFITPMAKIHKQLKRQLKKISLQTIPNIFVVDGTFQNILPRQIFTNLSKVTELSVQNIEEFIEQPTQLQFAKSLEIMRSALVAQRQKMSNFPFNEQMLNNMYVQQDNREQTKKTVTTLHSDPQQKSHQQLNEQEDNIFFQSDYFKNSEKALGKDQSHPDIFEFEDRNYATDIPAQQELDILSLIN